MKHKVGAVFNYQDMYDYLLRALGRKPTESDYVAFANSKEARYFNEWLVSQAWDMLEQYVLDWGDEVDEKLNDYEDLDEY